jgi:hypothetical protein
MESFEVVEDHSRRFKDADGGEHILLVVGAILCHFSSKGRLL